MLAVLAVGNDEVDASLLSRSRIGVVGAVREHPFRLGEGGFMVRSGRRRIAMMALICVASLVLGWRSNAQSTTNDTFTITVSLPAATVHVGEVPVIEEITENKTNHIVYAGWGDGGPVVGLTNSKGEDIVPHVMGNERKETDAYLGPLAKRLEPSYRNLRLWHVRTEQGYLVSGIYKIRIHRLDFKNGDIKSRVEVYSNTVTLTVVP